MIAKDRTWIKVCGLLLVVFALGGVTGAAIDRIYRSEASSNRQAIPARDTATYFDTLKSEVNLSAEQAEQIGAILDEMRDQYKTVCAEVRPRYYTLRETARVRMRALLAPDQQERFDAIITQDDCKCPEQKK